MSTTTPPSSIAQESVAQFVVGDGPAPQDALEIQDYVDDVARFLTAPATLPPLTMSVEGDWGSGKSTFMGLLQKAVKTQMEQRGERAHVVTFNAWRYEKHEALWAAFALNFARTLRNTKTWPEQLRASFDLLRQRLDFEEGSWRIVRSAAMLLALVAVFAVALVKAFVPDAEALRPAWIIGALAVLGGVVEAGRHAFKTVGSPFENDLKKYFDAPDYRGNRAFVEMFHDDFAKIVKAYVAKGERVFVFIDDLDRCDLGKAAGLLQALNLMMSGDGLPIIYVLGIDREVVSAGIAVNLAKQVAYLYPDATKPADATRATMRFALEYLEKFVQVPFRMPSPSASAIKKYVKSITVATDAQPSPGTGSSSAATPPKPPIETVWVQVGADSDTLRTLCEEAAPLLDNNPRRVKQYLNVLRLNVVLAHTRGLFRQTIQRDAMTLEQLARFVAVTLRYPALVGELRDDPSLLSDLEEYVFNSDGDGLRKYKELKPIARSYADDPKLMTFLFDAGARRIGMLDLSSLLQTVPEVSGRRTAQPAPPVDDEPTTAPATPPAGGAPSEDPVASADGDSGAAAPYPSATSAEAVVNAGPVDPRVDPAPITTAQSIGAAAQTTSTYDLGFSANLGFGGSLDVERIPKERADEVAPPRDYVEMTVARSDINQHAPRERVHADESAGEHLEDNAGEDRGADGEVQANGGAGANDVGNTDDVDNANEDDHAEEQYRSYVDDQHPGAGGSGQDRQHQ